MREPDLIQQQRDILRAFRQATAQRAQVEADAEARLKAGRAAADAALDQTRQQASAQLAEARKAQTIARVTLDRAGLGDLGEGLPPGPTAAAASEKPERELARRVSAAVAIPPLIQSDIIALQRCLKSRRVRQRLLIGVPALAVLVLVIVGGLGLLARQNARQMAEQISLPETAEAAQALTSEPSRLTPAALAAASVTIPAGEFLMGSTDADEMAAGDEKPQHTVYLDAFQIDRTEVTNAMYAKCVVAGACQAHPLTYSAKRADYYGNPKFGNYPVICVTWNDAQAYCAWAGGRLPTEAEWEKAARGTDGRIYPWGDEQPGAKANYNMNVGDTKPVGAYPEGASPYGVLDMAGNVWEWTTDWYSDTYYASSPARNPIGPSAGTTRVLRGGSWPDNEGSLRAAARSAISPGLWYNDHGGFRCVYSP